MTNLHDQVRPEGTNTGDTNAGFGGAVGCAETYTVCQFSIYGRDASCPRGKLVHPNVMAEAIPAYIEARISIHSLGQRGRASRHTMPIKGANLTETSESAMLTRRWRAMDLLAKKTGRERLCQERKLRLLGDVVADKC